MAKNYRSTCVWVLLLTARTAMGAIVTGAATEVAPNVPHPNGNTYDQVLMTGATATVQSDPGQVARTSFIDLNGDIVQVEISGAGTLTIALAAASGPALAAKYNQPTISYIKGHASLTVVDSDATTNIGVFTVGTETAVNQSLFRAGEMYDGIADIQRLSIVANPINPNGSVFGGIRMGNTQFWGTSGKVGIEAENIHVQNIVTIGDLWATDAADPVLTFGVNSQFGSVTVAGGDLSQPNGKPIEASGYFYSLNIYEGRTSNGIVLPIQSPRAQLSRNGVIETIRVPTFGFFVVH